jgi:6-phosphogluconolactonase
MLIRPEIIVLPSSSYAAEAGAYLFKTIKQMCRQSPNRRISCALAGGRTPRDVYRSLVTVSQSTDFDWQNLDFYFGDERAVPADDPRSNWRMARESLFSPLSIPEEHIFRIEGESASLCSAAVAYAEILPVQLDLLILGIGTDGHTASLFPGDSLCSEINISVAAVDNPPLPPARITLTPRAISSAGKIVLLACGSEKARALSRTLEEGSLLKCPARLALPGTWLLDEGAAAEIILSS